MNRTYSVGAIVIVLLLGAGGFFFWSKYQNDNGDETVPGETLSAKAVLGVTLFDENGNPRALADYKGKNVIIQVWATWCPYCRGELKELSRVKDEYGEKIEIIAIDRGETPEAVRLFLSQKNLDGDLQYFFDPDDSFFKAIGGFSMPETILIDKKGEVRFHKRGPMKTEELRRRAQDIFKI